MADIDSYLPDSDRADGTAGVAVPDRITQVGGKDNSSFLQPLSLDSTARLIIAPLTNSSIIKAQLQDNAGTAITVGQKTMVNSVPVTIASDQTVFPVSQSGTWNITNISGTVSLPTGAATSANQLTEITSLQLIDNPIGSVAAGTAGVSSFLTGGVFNTSLPTVTNGQQVATQLDSSGRIIISPITNTSIVKAQLEDNSGNAVLADNNQLLTQDTIATAGQNRAQSVTTSAAEALGAATILVNRKVIIITPTNGIVYWGFANTVTTVSGTPIFKNQTFVIAATDNVHIYLIAASTIDCRIAEGS